MLSRSDILDPNLISVLSQKEIAGPPSSFPLRGSHQSSKRGASLEFSEHTEYSHGDDLRNLDWKVYAKSDKYFVKRFEDERQQRAVFVVDASASMSYGAKDDGLVDSKYHLAAKIAVALASCLLRQGDSVGLELAGGENKVFLPPKSGMPQLDSMIEILSAAIPSGLAGLNSVCRGLGDRLRSAAAVFLISDFLDAEIEDFQGIKLLKARGLSPRMVQLLHADELDLPHENSVKYLDLEGSDALTIDPLAIRRSYAEEIRSHVTLIAKGAEHLGAPYGFISTNDDPAQVLSGMARRMGAN